MDGYVIWVTNGALDAETAKCFDELRKLRNVLSLKEMSGPYGKHVFYIKLGKKEDPGIGINDNMDVLYLILSELPVADLNPAARVCRLWNKVCNSEHIWGRIFKQMCDTTKTTLGGGELMPSRSAFYSSYMKFTSLKPGIVVSEDGRSIHSGDSVTCWRTSILNCPLMRTGAHLFVMRYDQIAPEPSTGPINTWKVVAGVISAHADLQDGKWLGSSTDSIGFSFARGAMVNPAKRVLIFDHPEGACKSGALFGILVNCTTKRISFSTDLTWKKRQVFSWAKENGEDKNWDELKLAIGFARCGHKITLLTHHYIPPEQAKHELRKIVPRTPLYKLRDDCYATEGMMPSQLVPT